jgi:hypothetical protein
MVMVFCKQPLLKLSWQRIEALASQEGVHRVAVENFLATLGDFSQTEALANLEIDSSAYGWGTATGRAIQQGIMEATP